MSDANETPSSTTLRRGPLSGLICAYHFRAGGTPEPVPEKAIGDALATQEGWVWLHLNLADARSRGWLAQPGLMAPGAVALFAQGEERLSLDTDGETVFGILADFERGLEPEDGDVGRLRFVFRPGLLVTARRHALVCIDETRKLVEAGTRYDSPAALIEATLDRFADHLALIGTEMIDDLDSIEDRVVSDVVENLRLRLVPIRRTAVRLRRQVTSLAAALRSFGQRVTTPDHPAPLSATRLAGRFEAIDGDLASIQERSKLLQDEVAAKVAEETNNTLRAISFMTAFLLPGSLVASLFGMNVADLPFLHTPAGFWIVCVLAAVATAAFYLMIRRSSLGPRS
jgi:zinc transporter